MINELNDAFKKALKDALEIEAQALAEGGASSFEDYRYRVGIRKGIARSWRMFEEVMEKIYKEEDF